MHIDECLHDHVYHISEVCVSEGIVVFVTCGYLQLLGIEIQIIIAAANDTVLKLNTTKFHYIEFRYSETLVRFSCCAYAILDHWFYYRGTSC